MNVKEASEFMVSIRLMTYNHDYFIEEAMRGIDMQQTNFNFEVVFGDDFSTDQTLFKIKNFQFTNPKLNVNILNRKKGDSYDVLRQEKGRLFNFIDIINNCKGKYIALLDGDDYWTDPLKLQKQVDFLDANIVYSYCGHKSNILSNKILKPITIDVKEITFEKLINQNFVNTATLVFRKAVLGDLPNFFNKVPAGDWLLQLIALKRGKGYVLKDFMSVYRIHQEGVWTSLSSEKMCEQGVKVLEKTKLIYNDRKSIKLIDNAILNRRKKFNVSHVPVHLRIKKRLFKILKKCFKI
jgi:glycosyltransferase involved in cell wall biosynthesis